MATRIEQEYLIKLGEDFLVQNLASPLRAIRSTVVEVKPVELLNHPGKLFQAVAVQTVEGKKFDFNTARIIEAGIFTDRSGQRYKYFQDKLMNPDILGRFSIEEIAEGMEIGFLSRPLVIARRIR